MKRNLLALAVLLLCIALVYSTTSTINTTLSGQPGPCRNVTMPIGNICYNAKSSMLNNFQPGIDIEVAAPQHDINGFKVDIIAEKGMAPALIFRTVRKGSSQVLHAPFDRSVFGDVRKVLIRPILNIDKQILYCNAAVEPVDLQMCP